MGYCLKKKIRKENVIKHINETKERIAKDTKF